MISLILLFIYENFEIDRKKLNGFLFVGFDFTVFWVAVQFLISNTVRVCSRFQGAVVDFGFCFGFFSNRAESAPLTSLLSLLLFCSIALMSINGYFR